MELADARLLGGRVLDEVEKAVIGKRDVLRLIFITILGRGHVLIEDVPGLAKTLIARSFARALGLSFDRIQFTPDLLPADITGSSIWDQRDGAFEFRKGPVFTNLLLGDEINRAPPKTQAALLEAMQEGQVTAEDMSHPLPDPFIVIATENPVEFEGTYPLPEAQLDRFLARVRVGYPDRAQEWEILRRRVERRKEEPELERVLDRTTLVDMQETLENVYVHESVGLYIVDLVEATRRHDDVEIGVSPRGSLALMNLARGHALMEGRSFVTPDDVKAIAVPALAHRLSLRPEMWVRRVSDEDVVGSVLTSVPAPAPQPAPVVEA